MTDKSLRWRKSSYSGDGGAGGGDCVEAALTPDDRLVLRDSKNPAAGTVTVSRSWIDDLKTGRFDDCP